MSNLDILKFKNEVNHFKSKIFLVDFNQLDSISLSLEEFFNALSGIGSFHDVVILKNWNLDHLRLINKFIFKQLAIITESHLDDIWSAFYDWSITLEEFSAIAAEFSIMKSVRIKKEDIIYENKGFEFEKKLLFLDRDGVINIDHGYVKKIEDVQLVNGIEHLLSLARNKNFIIAMVTNQSGIGRGLYSLEDFESVQNCIMSLLKIENQRIDHVEYSTFHPDSQDKRYQFGRQFKKPRPGMILKVAHKFNSTLKNSIMIGDRISDIKSALLADVNRIYLLCDDSAQVWEDLKKWVEQINTHLFVKIDISQVKKINHLDEVNLV